MTTTPTTTTTTPPSTPILYGPLNVEYLNESWCELQYKSGCSSTGSISHLNHSVNPEILEKLLQEAQKDASSQRQSPTLLPEPHQPVRLIDSTTTKNRPALNTDIMSSSSSVILAAKASSTATTTTMTTKMCKSATTDAVVSAPVAVVTTSVSSGRIRSKASPFCQVDDYDDDVDLEYVEDDDDDDNDPDDDTNVVDESGDMSSYGTIRAKITSLPKISSSSSCVLEGATASSTPCPNCLKQKKQIDLLIERQVKNEKEIIRIRNDYEVKLLNKSLEFSMHPATTTTKSTTNQTTSSNRPVVVSSSDYNICVGSSSSSSTRSIASSSSTGANTPATTTEPVTTSRDWIKYFASRPQTQPPKEWNFVHPNSSKSKYANFESSTSTKASTAIVETKLLSRESIGKLIFTHMASFIVGATLMFLVLKRHFNFKNAVYFI